MDRLRLPAERVEAVVVEVGCRERRIPLRRKAPRAVVEAFAGDVDIVAVEHAVDEAAGEIGGGESRRRLADQIEQPERIFFVVARGCFGIEICEAVTDELGDILGLAEEREPLERADADMPVAQPRQNGRAGGGRLVAALQRLAGLE